MLTKADRDLNQVVQQAMSETFEGMAFLVISPAQELNVTEVSKETEKWIWAGVEVKEPTQGYFLIIFSRSVAEDLEKILFGEEEGQGLEKLDDMLKELVNTMAGRCLNNLVPADTAFALGLPDIGHGWPDEKNRKIYLFNTDEGKPLAAMIELPDKSRNN